MRRLHLKGGRPLLLLGLLVGTLLLAYLLRDVVEVLLVRPLMYLFWALSLLYHALPQPVVWVALVLLLFYLVFARALRGLDLRKEEGQVEYQRNGPVQELASHIGRKDGGIYFRWQTARTLAMIARDLQEMRGPSQLWGNSQAGRRLNFEGKDVSPEVRRYLEAGLHSSFTEYQSPQAVAPQLQKLLRLVKMDGDAGSHGATPFDIDLGAVVEYLEKEMENQNDFRRA